jgi:SET domain-containing protein
LSVKGTTITKFDEKISVSKATGRKTDEVVTQIATFGKIALKKLLEELKDAYFSTRINENTILLKII